MILRGDLLSRVRVLPARNESDARWRPFKAPALRATLFPFYVTRLPAPFGLGHSSILPPDQVGGAGLAPASAVFSGEMKIHVTGEFSTDSFLGLRAWNGYPDPEI